MEITVGPAYWPVLGWTSLLAFAQTVVDSADRVSRRGSVAGHDRGRAVRLARRRAPRRDARLAGRTARSTSSPAPAGGWTIATTIVGLLVGGVSRRMFADGAFVPAVLCGLAVLVRDLIFWIGDAHRRLPAGFRDRARARRALARAADRPGRVRLARRARPAWSPTRRRSSGTGTPDGGDRTRLRRRTRRWSRLLRSPACSRSRWSRSSCGSRRCSSCRARRSPRKRARTRSK